MNVTTATAFPATAGGPTPREQRAEALARQKLQDARSAVEILKQQKPFRADGAASQRKAAAKQRVDQLKAQIQSLQMSGFVDPKRLAQLARELKAAVKAYGASGGSMSDLGVAGTRSAASLAQTAELPTDEGSTGSTSTDADTSGQTGADDTSIPVDPYRKAADDALAHPSGAGGSSDRADDRAFLNTVKGLANQLRAMARRAAQADAPDARRDAADAEQAIAETLREIENAGRDLGATGVSVVV